MGEVSVKQATKRNTAIALAIIFYIILMVCTILEVIPSGDLKAEQLARDDAGNVYVAGSAGEEILVYKLDAAGGTHRYYRCRREASSVELLCGYYGGKIYIVQVWHEDNEENENINDAADAEQHFSIWETEDNEFQCILQGTIENDTTFTDITVDEEGFFLAGRDLQTNEILRYRYQDENLQVLMYKMDFVPLTVSFGGGGLYVLSGDDQVYFINADGSRQPRSELGNVAVLITDGSGIYWQNIYNQDIHYLSYDGAEGDVIQDIGLVQDIIHSDYAQNDVLILREGEENRLLLIDQSLTDWQYITIDETGLKVVLASNQMPMIMVTLTYIAVWAAFVLVIYFIRDKSRMLYRVLKTIIGLSGSCLVMMMVLVNFQSSGSYSGMWLVVMALIEWLVIIMITLFFLRHIRRNISLLISWMDRISRGEYDIDTRKAPDDEFGVMWTALERMCKNLRMQKYRHSEVTDYLYQYAPRNFEMLFDKENLQDVEVGETKQLSVTLGMISIIDKETLLTGRTQKQYMQYVNKLMDLLFSQRESEQAIFLQDGSNLENVKIVFKGGESAPVAVQYSVECMEALLRRTENRYDTTPFILLHTAAVSSGLAGGSRQVYPYVTSLEMETLGRYVGRLKDSGVRIVVTEHTWQQVQGQVEGRYLGYVTSPDQKYEFRLYEIMDACPQSQKLGRIKNRERFAQALELFYSNDLYLARNAFADVLKECPDDGISEWYVFACDKLFNEGDMADKRYELFGREEFR